MNPEDSPFTPGQPVPLEFFVGRAEEISKLQGATRRAFKRRRPEILFVAGERGIGKSSLVSIVRSLVEQKEEAIAAHVHLNKVDSLPEMMQGIFDRLLKDNLREPWFEKLREPFGKQVQNVGIGGVTVEFKAKKEDLGSLQHHFALTTQALLKKLEKERQGMLLIWDDINGLASSSDFGPWLKSTVDEIFTSNMDLPLCIVLVGTEEQRRQLIASHESLNRMFKIIDINPWSDGETASFYKQGFDNNKKNRLSKTALGLMVEHTGGLPILAQEIGDAVWRVASQEGRIDELSALRGIFDAAGEIGRKILAHGVMKELRSKKYRSILNKIGIEIDISSASEFSRKKMKTILSEAEIKVMDNFLNRMRKLGAILPDESGERGVYHFPNRLYALYFFIEARQYETEKHRPDFASAD